MQKTLCVLAMLSLVAGGCKPRDGTAAVRHRAAPDFRLDTLDHQRFYLNAHRGKVVVLIFWMTTCAICKQELVEFQAIAEERASEGVVVASVCTDPENLDAARRLVDRLGIRFPALLDQGGRVSKRYGARALPTTVILDRDGRISLWQAGYNEMIARQLRSHLEQLAGKSGSD